MKNNKKNIILLGITSLLTDFSSEMINPILPMFIETLKGGGLVIGLIGGLRDTIENILKIIFGFLSDKIGKKKIFVVYGYLTSAIFKLFYTFSKFWSHILIFISLERVGKGMRTAPRDAIISQSMPKERGKGFGIHRSLDTFGAILGSILVFILFWFLGCGFRLIIFIGAIIGFFSLIPLYFVKEIKATPQIAILKKGLKNLSTPLKLFIIIACIFALSNFSYMFFILKAKASFTGKLSTGIPIILYILYNIFYASFAIPFGRLFDKIGRKKVLILGYFLFSLTCLGFAIFNSLAAFIILFISYGIAFAIFNGNQRAYVADLAKEELKATSLGAFHTSIGLAGLIGNLIAGFLWQNISYNAPFFYGSIISLFSCILFIFTKL